MTQKNLVKYLEISALNEGDQATHDYYSFEKELVLAKGTVLSKDDVKRIKERIDKFLYILADSDDDSFVTTGEKEHKPNKEKLPSIILNSAKGEEGFYDLLLSQEIIDLDKEIKSGANYIKPLGNSIAKFIKNNTKEVHKNREMVDALYKNSLYDIKKNLVTIFNGEAKDLNQLREVPFEFMKSVTHERETVLETVNSKTAHTDDDYIYYHLLNTALLSMAISVKENFSFDQTVEIGTAAMVSDIGMLALDDSIRFKKGVLSDKEIFEIKKHPVEGVLILSRIKHVNSRVKMAVYQTHEMENGTGYPKSISTNKINDYSKIIQVADTYSALISQRPHREAYSPYKAMEIVIKSASSGILSKSKTLSFLRIMSLFPIGSVVKLSSGEYATVIASNEHDYTRPVVEIIKPSANTQEESLIKDLSIISELRVMDNIPALV